MPTIFINQDRADPDHRSTHIGVICLDAGGGFVSQLHVAVDAQLEIV